MDGKYSLFFAEVGKLLSVKSSPPASSCSSGLPPPPLFPEKNPEKLLSRPELLSRHATASPTTSHLSRPFSDKETFHAISLKLPPKKCVEKNLGFFYFPLLYGKTRGERMARVQLFFFLHFHLFQRAVSHNNKMFSAFTGVTFRQPLFFSLLSSPLSGPLVLAIWPPPKPKRTTTIFPQKKKREEEGHVLLFWTDKLEQKSCLYWLLYTSFPK